jgi:5-oxoprolinase (ATP-hydrolysing)
VANAPHLPVHLGAMSEAVRFQVAYYGPQGPGAAEGLQVRLTDRIGMGPG